MNHFEMYLFCFALFFFFFMSGERNNYTLKGRRGSQIVTLNLLSNCKRMTDKLEKRFQSRMGMKGGEAA